MLQKYVNRNMLQKYVTEICKQKYVTEICKKMNKNQKDAYFPRKAAVMQKSV